mgnify:CR=1 FL=1|tara:strand:- start:520 stop:1101 length:582 start_codon:yes stop_codon:yes gene_type:complete
MLREVLTHPNLRLTKVCDPVTKFDEDLKTLIVDLIDTCRVMFGAGLAAPQVGVKKRIIVIKPATFKVENPFPAAYNSEYMVMINPVIETFGEEIEWREGCLSLPGVEGRVKRKESCVVKFLDETGEMQTIEAGFPFAGGLQHEIDHLDGILYTKRMEKKKQRSLMWKIQRIKRKQMIADRKRKRELRNGGHNV